MPFYDYKCTKCDFEFESFNRRYHEYVTCPECKELTAKLVIKTPAAVGKQWSPYSKYGDKWRGN